MDKAEAIAARDTAAAAVVAQEEAIAAGTGPHRDERRSVNEAYAAAQAEVNRIEADERRAGTTPGPDQALGVGA